MLACYNFNVFNGLIYVNDFYLLFIIVKGLGPLERFMFVPSPTCARAEVLCTLLTAGRRPRPCAHALNRFLPSLATSGRTKAALSAS